MLPVRRRLVNGVAGAIGSSLSFALAARLVESNAPVFAVLGLLGILLMLLFRPRRRLIGYSRD